MNRRKISSPSGVSTSRSRFNSPFSIILRIIHSRVRRSRICIQHRWIDCHTSQCPQRSSKIAIMEFEVDSVGLVCPCHFERLSVRWYGGRIRCREFGTFWFCVHRKGAGKYSEHWSGCQTTVSRSENIFRWNVVIGGHTPLQWHRIHECSVAPAHWQHIFQRCSWTANIALCQPYGRRWQYCTRRWLRRCGKFTEERSKCLRVFVQHKYSGRIYWWGTTSQKCGANTQIESVEWPITANSVRRMTWIGGNEWRDFINWSFMFLLQFQHSRSSTANPHRSKWR